MAESNGELGGFAWLHTKRLEALRARGLHPEALKGLQACGATVAAALADYRTKRHEAGSSGKFSAQGLRDLEGELAATASGDIRRALDDTHLRENMAQTKAKLAPKVADPTVALLGFWQRMELRSTFAAGLTYQDATTGQLRYDSLKFDDLYRSALAAGNQTLCQALEEWPTVNGQCPVEAQLVQQGQAQRLRAVDPVAAKALDEQETIQRAMEAMRRDALQELPLPADDPIAAMAGPSAS